jgi:hypothetical protein
MTLKPKIAGSNEFQSSITIALNPAIKMIPNRNIFTKCIP